METTPKAITVVYRVALFSLVVIAAFVLLLFGHRGYKGDRAEAVDTSSYRFVVMHGNSNRQFTKGGFTANTQGLMHVTPRGVIPPPVGSWSIWEGGTQVVANTSLNCLPVTASGVTLGSMTSLGGVHITLKFASASVPAYIGAQLVVNFNKYGVLSTPIDILSHFTSTARGTLTGTYAVENPAQRFIELPSRPNQRYTKAEPSPAPSITEIHSSHTRRFCLQWDHGASEKGQTKSTLIHRLAPYQSQ